MAEVMLSTAWKQSLTTTKMKPFAMQVSLYDLLFYEDAEKNSKIRFTAEEDITPSFYKSRGFELPHSIIVFNEQIYEQSTNLDGTVINTGKRIINKRYDPKTEMDQAGTLFEEFIAHGFDMALPYFDIRSKPLFLTSSNSNKILKMSEINDILNIIRPGILENSDYYYSADQYDEVDKTIIRAKGFKVWDKDAAMKPTSSVDFYKRSILSNPSGDENTWQVYVENPWAVASEEDFSSSGTNNADIILTNKDIAFEKRFITNPKLSAYNGVCLNYRSINVWKQFFQYYNSKLPYPGDYEFGLIIENFLNLTGEVANLSPCIKFLLKHCYIWFKCSFYADYVDYRDFDQSLNKEATVIHNNLMLTETGNFNRYREMYTEGKMSARDYIKKTHPYFPETTPSKDLVRKQLLNDEDFSNVFTRTNMQKLIEEANNPESKVGALPIEPFELLTDNTTSPEFTSKEKTGVPPPIWFDPESRKSSLDYNTYPTVIGKDGNLITKGRIISPTIDELWQSIKELIGGKRSDTDPNIYDDGGYPKNNSTDKQIPVNTQPSILHHSFKTFDDSIKQGDPISIEYFPDADDPNYKVKSWISNPETIKYNVIKELQDISDILCNVAPDIMVIQNKIENLSKPDPTKYIPSDKPLSLRELEGLLKGIRWNLVYYMTFLKANGVYAGSLGRPNTDVKSYNEAAGTAYMLHKDYDANSSWVNPTTVYDERINRGISGIIGRGLGKIKDNMFGDSQNQVPPWSVYLAANGEYYSTWQNCNIPVREDEIY